MRGIIKENMKNPDEAYIENFAEQVDHYHDLMKEAFEGVSSLQIQPK